ncbi:MAG: TetR/AcrR family transcriptional regulator [Alphaproteobacteria bacterium]|nr:TetR/AcrR family transcriptional regulator [Alphaproteobacteria bacterium]
MKGLSKQQDRSERTIETILGAAQSLFAQKGFAGTSISMIAKDACIPQSLIYHHFDNKQDLWRAVKARMITLSKITEEEPLDEDTPSDILRKILTMRFELYASSPDVARIAAWQNLDSASEQLQWGTSVRPEKWIAALEKRQRDGHIPSNLNVPFFIEWVFQSVSSAFLDPALKLMDNSQRQKEYFDMLLRCFTRMLG